MTDKFNQIANCYGAGYYKDLYAKDVKAYVEGTAKDVHCMWDEIQRLRAQLDRAMEWLDHVCPWMNDDGFQCPGSIDCGTCKRQLVLDPEHMEWLQKYIMEGK